MAHVWPVIQALPASSMAIARPLTLADDPVPLK